jgi:hypothetical protein
MSEAKREFGQFVGPAALPFRKGALSTEVFEVLMVGIDHEFDA